MNKNIKYIVVPDVHGRDFYIESLDTFIDGTDAHMIFLGDYLDPYPNEGISPELAIERFKHIIDMKKNNPERITLLIGNHDFHYIDGSRRGCRMDYYNKDEICGLFLNNMDLFEYVKCVKIGKKNFVFSHAGFGFAWFSMHSDMIGVCDKDDHNVDIERKAFTYDTIASVDWKILADDRINMNAYGEIGNSRGGWCSHPSFIWADLSDILMDNDIRLANCIQVYGHTQMSKDCPVHFDNCYMLDCKNIFYINDNGSIFTSDFKVIKNNGEQLKQEYIEYYKRMSAFFI